MPREPQFNRNPRSALQRIYEMALTMSNEQSYAEYDEATGERLGVRQDVLDDLETVRKHFNLRKPK